MIDFVRHSNGRDVRCELFEMGFHRFEHRWNDLHVTLQNLNITVLSTAVAQ